MSGSSRCKERRAQWVGVEGGGHTDVTENRGPWCSDKGGGGRGWD